MFCVHEKIDCYKKATQKHPDLLPTLDAIVEPVPKDDPMSPLRWMAKSIKRLSEALNEQGFEVSPRQVCRLLDELDYQLAANRKSLEGGRPQYLPDKTKDHRQTTQRLEHHSK
jgi:transposase